MAGIQVNGFNNIVTSFYAKVSKPFLLSNAPFITAYANLRQFESVYFIFIHTLFSFFFIRWKVEYGSWLKGRKVLCSKAQNDGLFFLFANHPIICIFSAEIIFVADWLRELKDNAKKSMSISNGLKNIFWIFSDLLLIFISFFLLSYLLWFFFIYCTIIRKEFNFKKLLSIKPQQTLPEIIV